MRLAFSPLRRRFSITLGLAVIAGLVVTMLAAANVALTQVSADPYTNSTSQHATELEPDTFADHGTVVSTFQVRVAVSACRIAGSRT